MNGTSVRDKLLRIATQRFAAVGYEATTMRSIAGRAGVTLPTIYHYFGDKATLYLEVCLATFAPRAERALASYSQSPGSEAQRVLDFFVDLASDLLENENTEPATTAGNASGHTTVRKTRPPRAPRSAAASSMDPGSRSSPA